MPNVLMIALDDVNAWATLKSTYGGTMHTPNLDRLAGSGVSFTEAHVSAPICNPARASVLSGLNPLQSGILTNLQDMFGAVAPSQTLPGLLQAAGWHTATAGKVFHLITPTQAASIHDTVLSTQHSEGVAPAGPNFVRTTTTTLAGYWTGDPALMEDSRTVALTESFLAGYAPDPDDAGLFLSVGLVNTHAPWVVPKEFFDLYPLDQIVLPANPAGDLDDVPDFALRFTDPLLVDEMVAAGDWQARVQAYLATISYMDSMVGRLLDALAGSAIADDTMVVVWSDHGFHIGEKDALAKNSLWAEATRAPLIIADPTGTRAGEVEDRVVGMTDLFPTILAYAGLSPPDGTDGASLLELVRSGDATGLPDHAVTMVEGSFSLRSQQYRYTRYEDGSEELYDVLADPREYANLAADPALAPQKAALSAALDEWLDQFSVLQNRGVAPTVLQGTTGRDVLIAGFGADTLLGGPGDDTHLLRDATAVVVEEAEGGHDSILIGGEWTDFVLPAWVEDLELNRSGTDAPETGFRRVIGNDLANRIRSSEAVDLAVRAGGGDDLVTGGRSPNRLFGEEGNDLLRGGIAQDRLDGGAGNDSLIGGAGNDTYVASAGRDVGLEIGIGGRDVLDVTDWTRAATTIAPQLDAGGRLARVVFTNELTGDVFNVAALAGRNPIEALMDSGRWYLLGAQLFRGGAGADDVVGSAFADTLVGGQGDDRLHGADSDDSLVGAAGRDTLIGGDGADTLALGTAHDDVAFGDPGDDLITVATGRAMLDGGEGNDVLRLGGDGRMLDFRAIERIEMSATAVLDARALRDPAIDAVAALAPGATLLLEGVGAVNLAGLALDGVLVLGDDLANRAVFGGGAFQVFAGSGADLIRAVGDGGQTIEGGADADTLDGGAGDDRLTGGSAADLLLGGAGDDILVLATATGDRAFGGLGDDLFLIGDGTGILDGGAGQDTLRGQGDLSALVLRDIERIEINGATVLAAAHFRAGTLESIAGRLPDLVLGIAGAVDFGGVTLSQLTLAGGAGRDVFTAGGDELTIRGLGGNDRLEGLAGAQTILGGEGSDLLRGGDGDDLLSGGDGAATDGVIDRFEFRAGAAEGADTIIGFQAGGAGADRVDILGIGAPGSRMRFAEALAADLLLVSDTAAGALLEYRASASAPYEASVLLAGVPAAQLPDRIALFGD